MDYSELKTMIASWLKRSDMADVIPSLIVLAETKLGEDLNGRGMDAIDTLPLVVADAYIQLPDDFRNLRSLSIALDGYLRTPEYVTPEQLESRYHTLAPGWPVAYTVIGDQLKFAPVPDMSYPLEIVYQRLIPPLSDAAPTNWLLERSPNAYLFGALMMAQPYIFNDQRLAMFQQMYNDAVNGININDSHVGGDLRVQSDARIA
jgi:hypothetical protein